MKKAQYGLLAMLFMLLSFSGFAAETNGWNFGGKVGLVSNYLSTGETMTDDNPSLQMEFKANNSWFFAQLKLNTIQSDFFDKLQLELIPSIGVTYQAGPVGLYATYRLYRYTGGKGTWWEESVSTMNYDELAVGADWNGFYGEVAYALRADDSGNHNIWVNLGYGHSFGQVDLDAFVNFKYHDWANTWRFANFQARATYNFNNGISPYAGFSLGGQDANNESLDNLFFVGVDYRF